MTQDITVRTLLELPEVTGGDPIVLTGKDRLDTPVRWVHIAEADEVTELLEGGELLLSSSSAFRHSAERTRAFLEQLKKAGAAGFAVETIDEAGLTDSRSLEILRTAGAGIDMPVIALRARTRFVRITQQAHRLLIARQLEVIERTRELHEVFTELSLGGADESAIVAEAAQRLQSPVVLEDAVHRILAFDDAGDPEAVDAWPLHTGQASAVGVKGRRWGRLVAPRVHEDDAYAAEVLERAGQAITLVRAHMHSTHDLRMRASDRFVAELPQMTEAQAVGRMRGVDLSGPGGYMSVAVHMGKARAETNLAGADHSDGAEYQLRERGLRVELVAAAGRHGLTAVTSTWHNRVVVALLGFPDFSLPAKGRAADELLTRLRGDLDGAYLGDLTMGAGLLHREVTHAGADLPTVVEVAQIAADMSVRSRPFYRFSDLRLSGLISSFQEDPRMRAFATAELGPLLAGEPNGAFPGESRRGEGRRSVGGASSEDLEFLWTYLLQGGQKAAISRELGISRPVVYSRARRIASTLGVSLDDPESAAALLVALLWWRGSAH